MTKTKLTNKETIFVDEYLIDFNGTRAYMVAYPRTKNKNTAGVKAFQLLRKDKIDAEIKKRMADRIRRTEIKQDDVVREFAKIAFANVSDFVKVVTIETPYDDIDPETGELVERVSQQQRVCIKNTDELTDDQKAAISSIKQGANGIEIRFHDKNDALTALGRHVGMFRDKLELSGTINNPMEGLTTEELKKLIRLE